MKSEQQFQQLMMQYQQLKNGALEIARLLEAEDFDSAITMIKQREAVFLSCKTIRRYLELTPLQKINDKKLNNSIIQRIIHTEKFLCVFFKKQLDNSFFCVTLES